MILILIDPAVDLWSVDHELVVTEAGVKNALTNEPARLARAESMFDAAVPTGLSRSAVTVMLSIRTHFDLNRQGAVYRCLQGILVRSTELLAEFLEILR